VSNSLFLGTRHFRSERGMSPGIHVTSTRSPFRALGSGAGSASARIALLLAIYISDMHNDY